MGTISTDQIQVGRRARFWEEAISDLYTRTSVAIENPVLFYGQIDWHKIGEVVLSDICSTRSIVTRQSRDIQPSEHNLIQINFQLEGHGTVVQDGRVAVTRPGEVTVYDSSRPYEMRFDGHFRQLSVDFPRSMFQDRLKTTERVTARIFSGLSGPGRFLYSFVQSLVLGRNDGDLMIANHLQDNLMELLGIALFSLGPASPIHESDAKMAALSRVKAYVLANLSNPSLSPTGISKAQGLSLRNLYYLFESDGSTVWRFIQDTRLDQCRRDIEDARMSGRSISDIALSRGFKDSAHFSRAFRDRFGLTPRECRAVWRAHAETGAGAGKLHAQTRDYS